MRGFLGAASVVLVPLLCAACATQTAVSKGALRETGKSVKATRYEPGQVRATATKAGDGAVRLTVVETAVCIETIETTLAQDVTTRTFVDPGQAQVATIAGVAGGAALVIGVVGGGALSLVTLYDVNERDAGGRLVPIDEQAGTGLWPIGITIAAASVAVGGAGLGAPVAVAMTESSMTAPEATTRDAEAANPNCDRTVPAKGPVVLVSGSDEQALGELNAVGEIEMQLVGAIDDAVARSARVGETPTIVAGEQRVPFDLILDWEGAVRVRPRDPTGEGVSIPLHHFPTASRAVERAEQARSAAAKQAEAEAEAQKRREAAALAAEEARAARERRQREQAESQAERRALIPLADEAEIFFNLACEHWKSQTEVAAIRRKATLTAEDLGHLQQLEYSIEATAKLWAINEARVGPKCALLARNSKEPVDCSFFFDDARARGKAACFKP